MRSNWFKKLPLDTLITITTFKLFVIASTDSLSIKFNPYKPIYEIIWCSDGQKASTTKIYKQVNSLECPTVGPVLPSLLPARFLALVVNQIGYLQNLNLYVTFVCVDQEGRIELGLVYPTCKVRYLNYHFLNLFSPSILNLSTANE